MGLHGLHLFHSSLSAGKDTGLAVHCTCGPFFSPHLKLSAAYDPGNSFLLLNNFLPLLSLVNPSSPFFVGLSFPVCSMLRYPPAYWHFFLLQCLRWSSHSACPKLDSFVIEQQELGDGFIIVFQSVGLKVLTEALLSVWTTCLLPRDRMMLTTPPARTRNCLLGAKNIAPAVCK